MASARKSSEALEFESFPGRADIQISKTVTTPGGDEIRAVLTTGGKVVLTAVGRPSSDVIIVDDFGSEDGSAVVYNKLWDTLRPIAEEVGKSIAGLVGGLIGGDGGGKNCESTTTVEADAKTGKTTVTMKMVCK